MKKVNESIYAKAVNHFGEEKQLLKLVEEMAELQQAIIKFHLYKVPSDGGVSDLMNLIEEIVDVEIMISQIKTIFDSEAEFEMYTILKEKKLDRLEALISYPEKK